jgi:transporter family-2 protein
MNALVLSVLVGLLGGLAVGLQNPLASTMGQRIGLLEGAFVIHVGGAVLAGLPLLVFGGGGLDRWREVPWYSLWAGGLGVILICAITFIIPRIGVAASVSLVVAAQLTVGATLDHYGWLGAAARPLDPARLAGMALLLAGGWLVLR